MTTTAGRRRAFAAAALLLVTVTAWTLASVPATAPPTAPPVARRGAHGTVAPTPAPANPARPHPRSLDPEDLAAGSRRDRRSVRAIARRFLAAFTHYELGRYDAAVAGALRLTATPRLAHELLTAPPRLPAGPRPPRARLVALTGIRIAVRRAWALARLRRGHARAGLALQLQRVHGRFFVTGLS